MPVLQLMLTTATAIALPPAPPAPPSRRVLSRPAQKPQPPPLESSAAVFRCFLRAGVAPDATHCPHGTKYDTWTLDTRGGGGDGKWTEHKGFNCFPGHGAKYGTAALAGDFTAARCEAACRAPTKQQWPWPVACTAVTLGVAPSPPPPPAPPPPPDPALSATPRHSVSGFRFGQHAHIHRPALSPYMVSVLTCTAFRFVAAAVPRWQSIIWLPSLTWCKVSASLAGVRMGVAPSPTAATAVQAFR